MRDLHGVTTLRMNEISKSKPHALLFDKIHLITNLHPSEPFVSATADMDFLSRRGLIHPIVDDNFIELARIEYLQPPFLHLPPPLTERF